MSNILLSREILKRKQSLGCDWVEVQALFDVFLARSIDIHLRLIIRVFVHADVLGAASWGFSTCAD